MKYINPARRFPTFAVIVLVIGIIWLLNDLGFFVVKVPWIPIILIVVAIGWIFNNYAK
ncbi:hypothetical protein JW968_04885 [Candidatus Woesearchaeota archaeon]|nr:hypothetical protein [Candidatus Woesearchaeota archaeon]